MKKAMSNEGKAGAHCRFMFTTGRRPEGGAENLQGTLLHVDAPIREQDYLEKVKQLTLEQGWAVSKPSTGEFLYPTDTWGFPKYPDRTVILSPDADLVTALKTFTEANAPFLGEADCWLGTWINPSSEDIYLDITTSCDELDHALYLTAQINAASKRKIIAMYNSGRDETVYL